MRRNQEMHGAGERAEAVAAGPARPRGDTYGQFEDRDVIGTKVPRKDAFFKVTGRAVYTCDVRLPGMLYAEALRSPHAAATVVDIDTTDAGRMPGVRAILTYVGKRIRFAGDEVAAVAADTLDQARDALAALKVTYEEYDHVVTLEDAMASGAPQVYETKANVGSPRVSEKGDINRGFGEAKAVVEGDYRTQVQLHSPMETHGCVASWDDDLRRLTVWVSTQGTFGTRSSFATYFGINEEDVRVYCDFIGGGFGSKISAGTSGVIAAELAQMTGLPVRFIVDRKGEQLSTGNRPDSVQRVKVGARADGTLSAIEVSGYATPGVGSGAGFASAYRSLYKIENYKTTEVAVYTNGGPSAAMRAPGHPQGVFPLECALDDLAYQLGIDPLQIRLVNNQFPLRKQELEVGAQRFGWSSRNPVPGSGSGPVKRGMGLATCTWTNGGQPGCTVRVTVSPNGRVLVENGAQDIGTGTKTWMAMLVAEELGLKPDQVDIKMGDTALPYGPMSGGSTTTPTLAPPTRQAGENARKALADVVAPFMGTTPDQLTFDDGQIIGPTVRIPFEQGCSYLSSSLVVEGTRTDDAKLKQDTVTGAHFAEVEVDTRTGKVRVLRVTAVHNAGRILNLLTAESQVIGGVIQGMNYALFEERVMDRASGLMLNANLESYKIGGSRDMPVIDPVVLDVSSGGTYVGAIGLGESPIIPTAAAIANAVYHAIGVRIRELPITPARVLEALGTIPASRTARRRAKGVKR